jgi:SAM-dependent methyltransferase
VSYAYQDLGNDEMRRMRAMERLWDPGTLAVFDRLGVGRGMDVAEVGAGAGSVALELAARVGPGGSVHATDLDVSRVAVDPAGIVSVHRHDIRAAALPSQRFDFVHARLLVEHVGLEVIPNLVAGLRPGGTLLVEDLDCASRGWYPENPIALTISDGLLDAMSRRGYDPFCGRKLPAALTAVGLDGVDAEGRVQVVRAGTSDTDFFKLSLLALRDTMITTGGVSATDFDTYIAQMDEAGRISLSAVMVACWGTKRDGAELAR